MSLEHIKVEQLENGLTAAFVNLPHFRTHAARLTINAGSLHETPDAYGAAHFLEHVTFQGTETMPTEQAVHDYSEIKGLHRNALTNYTHTTYLADGYELESVGRFVSDIALRPLLAIDALEGERKPIIDEIRGYASSPYFDVGIAHSKAVRGAQYARPIGATITDVERMTPEALRSFHQKHYRLGNAVLVLCSPDPIEKQREFAQTITARYADDGASASEVLELGPFNPEKAVASLQKVNLPPSAQSSISIAYGVPETSSLEEQISYNLVGMLLSKVAYNSLRRESALCYGANATVFRLSDLHFGRDKNWSQLTVSANLNGEDAVHGLTALSKNVLHKPLPEEAFNTILIAMDRDFDNVMQSTPSQVANRVKDMLSSSQRDEVALDEVKKLAENISLKTLRTLHKNITDTQPLVLATSPDTLVLEQIGDWAYGNVA